MSQSFSYRLLPTGRYLISRPDLLRGAHWVYLVDMLTLLQGKAILCYTPVIICRSGHATKPNVVSQITSLQRPTQLKLVGARPLLRSVVAQFTVVDQKERSSLASLSRFYAALYILRIVFHASHPPQRNAWWGRSLPPGWDGDIAPFSYRRAIHIVSCPSSRTLV